MPFGDISRSTKSALLPVLATYHSVQPGDPPSLRCCQVMAAYISLPIYLRGYSHFSCRLSLAGKFTTEWSPQELAAGAPQGAKGVSGNSQYQQSMCVFSSKVCERLQLTAPSQSKADRKKERAREQRSASFPRVPGYGSRRAGASEALGSSRPAGGPIFGEKAAHPCKGRQGPGGDGFTLPLAAAEGSTCRLALAQLASLQASHWRE